MPERSEPPSGAAKVAARTPARPLPEPSSRRLIPRIAATLIPVLQFWTFALWRVPRTLTPPPTAIIKAAASLAPVGPSATKFRGDFAHATPRVAPHPAGVTKNRAQPSQK